MPRAKKADTTEQEKVVHDLTKFDPIEVGMDALKEKTNLTADYIYEQMKLVEGKTEMAALKKLCTSTRTKITEAYKAAVAPALAYQKAAKAKETELLNRVKAYEVPFDKAAEKLKNEEAAAAAQAQEDKDAEIARLRAELAARDAADGVEQAKFEEKNLQVTITSKEQLTALGKVFGTAAVKGIKHDDDGVPYVLECVLRRKEIQE